MANRATKRAETSDLISRLPDELLTRILSFVPSVTSVRTCVLSKRWSRLWISVPSIDFNESSRSVSDFEDFIERFLSMNRVMSVRAIQFDVHSLIRIKTNFFRVIGDYEDEIEVSRADAWIASISERDAEEVHLSFPSPPFDETDGLGFPIYRIPDKFFIQNNLLILQLEAVVLKLPQTVCFPNLKKMNLGSIRFFDDISLKNLLFGSPVLRNLDIHLDPGDAPNTLYICSSSLRDLCLDWDPDYKSCGYNIVIDTPSLINLSIGGSDCSTYKIVNNLSSLVRANLYISKDETFLELLTQISHVKELVLGGLYRGIFDSTVITSIVTMPIFSNLIHLEVNFNWTRNSEILFQLIHNTPILVSLILYEPCSVKRARAWSEPHEVPQCFLSSIESVEIKGVGDSDQEMRMISYILKNAMVLKNLSFHSSHLAQVSEKKFLITLLSLPRSSATATCQFKNAFDY